MAERTLQQELEMTQAWVKESKKNIIELDPAQLTIRKKDIRALYLECKAFTDEIEKRIDMVGVAKPKAVDLHSATIDPLIEDRKWVRWGVCNNKQQVDYYDTEAEVDELVGKIAGTTKVKITYEVIV